MEIMEWQTFTNKIKASIMEMKDKHPELLIIIAIMFIFLMGNAIVLLLPIGLAIWGMKKFNNSNKQHEKNRN